MDSADQPTFSVRGPATDPELHDLFAAAWPDAGRTDWASILSRSLTWVTARRGVRLVGFVNVATDGGTHAFLLDTTVHPDEQRHGVGSRLVRAAADAARRSGAGWLHVDYEPHLAGFYRSCGFRPTDAGLLDLTAGHHGDPAAVLSDVD